MKTLTIIALLFVVAVFAHGPIVAAYTGLTTVQNAVVKNLHHTAPGSGN